MVAKWSSKESRGANKGSMQRNFHSMHGEKIGQGGTEPHIVSPTLPQPLAPAAHQIVQHRPRGVLQVLHVVQADDVVERVALEGQLVRPGQQRVV